MKIGAIIQARMSSTRLPGKVLKKLPFYSKITVLEQVINRLNRGKEVDTIVVATTDKKSDDAIEAITRKRKVVCFRGDSEDVLSRYYYAAKDNNFDVIVRITSDCPCIDPGIIDLIIKEHLRLKADYTSNTLKRSYPHGLDAEVFSFDVLAFTHKNAQLKFDREHVTPFITKNCGLFRIKQVVSPKKLFAPDIRITLDTEEDYTLLCSVFDQLYFKNKYFDAYDIVGLFNKKPWLKFINKRIVQ